MRLNLILPKVEPTEYEFPTQHQAEGTNILSYRLCNLFLDRWNLWPRLTFYRHWKERMESRA